MLNSESCEGVQQLLGNAGMKRTQNLVRNVSGESQLGPEKTRELCEKFTAVLYGLLFREMQKTIPQDEEASALADGVRGFLASHIPQAVAGSATDPLAPYMTDQIEAMSGGQVNEEI